MSEYYKLVLQTSLRLHKITLTQTITRFNS